MSKLEDELAFQFKAYKLNPDREFRFSPPRRYRFDFAFTDKLLAVEVEGGIWTGGRHVRPMGYSADIAKYNLACLRGWRVLRFTAKDIRSGGAIQTILEALK